MERLCAKALRPNSAKEPLATHNAVPKSRISTKRYATKGRARRFCRQARDSAVKALQNRNARITLT
jgi:hypothetical protein